MSDEVEVEVAEMIAAPIVPPAHEDGLVMEKLEEGGTATTSSSSSEQKKKKWWHRNEFRLLLLLLLIGGVVGLVVGLVTKDDNPSSSSSSAAAGGGVDTAGVAVPKEEEEEEDGNGDINRTEFTDTPTIGPSPAPVAAVTAMPYVEAFATAIPYVETLIPDDVILTAVIVDRSCEYKKSQTVGVSAPSYENVPSNNTNVTVVVEKKLSGGASAFDGNNAVVVSYNGNGTAGAVWALSRNDDDDGTDTSWEQTGVIQTNDEDQLGWDVAIKGDTFVVGAPGHKGRDIPLIDGWYWAGRGVAIVMAKKVVGEDYQDVDNISSGSSWYQEAILSPEVADDNAAFGTSVDIAECGCLIAVGAWHDRDSRGSVYIFSKNNNGEWTELQKLAPIDTRRSQSQYFHGNYGYTVAITNDYLAIKAPYDSYTGSYDYKDENRGVVYVYKRGEDGMFEQMDRLYTPQGTQVRTHLTDMIFLDDFLLVGAPGKNKVYVFEQINSSGEEEGDDDVGYQKTAELTPSDTVNLESYFGVSLDGKGSDVLVGDRGGQTSHLFSYEDGGGGGVWKEKAKFDGFNTALSGNTIVEHTPVTFEEMNGGEQYGGEVNFYDLECEV